MCTYYGIQKSGWKCQRDLTTKIAINICAVLNSDSVKICSKQLSWKLDKHHPTKKSHDRHCQKQRQKHSIQLCDPVNHSWLSAENKTEDTRL